MDNKQVLLPLLIKAETLPEAAGGVLTALQNTVEGTSWYLHITCKGDIGASVTFSGGQDRVVEPEMTPAAVQEWYAKTRAMTGATETTGEKPSVFLYAETALAGLLATPAEPFGELEEQTREELENLLAAALPYLGQLFTARRLTKTKAELKLKHRALHANSTGVMIIAVENGTLPITYVNPAFERMTGYALEEIKGLPCELLTLLSSDESVQELQQAMEERRESTQVVQYRRKSGETFFDEVKLSPIKNSRGETTHFTLIHEDITKWIRSEDERVKSAIRISALLRSLQSGILVEDEERRIVLVNEEFCAMFQIPVAPDQLIGADCSTSAENSKHFFADPEGFVKRIDEILAGREMVLNEELDLADGKIYERDYIPIYIEGDYRGHLWQYRNVTDRIVAERKLLESEERFRGIVESSSDWVWEVDAEGRYTYVSPKVYDHIGYAPEEILGKTPFDQMPEDEAARVRAVFGDILKERRIFTGLENKNIHKDGSFVYLETSGAPVFDGGGNLTGYRGVDRDITGQREYEDKLRTGRANLLSVTENTTDSIWLVDREYRLITMNSTFVGLFEAAFQRSVEEGDCHIEIIPEAMQDDWKRYYDNAFSGERFSIERTFSLNGKDLTTEISFNPVKDERGDITGVSVYARDITEYKQIIKELVHASRLAEESTRAKEQFLAHMSHEIRTPMNVILGLTNLLMRMELTGDQAHFLKMINSASENLLLIINDILDFSKIEAGRLEIQKRPVDLHEILDSLLRSAAILADPKGLQVRENIARDVPRLVESDPVRLQQIFLNLLSNAVKFTDQGQVLFSVAVLSKGGSGARLRFEVTDTGIGIEEKDLDTIFESFRQVSAVRKQRQSGTGLGLAIVERLVGMLNGEISVSSTPGEGTVFVVELPFALTTIEPDKVDAGISQLARDEADLAGKRALIVEDNPMNQLVVKNMLALWDVGYDIANDGREAIEKLEKERFDIVLMDLSMPVMDGYEAARYIRNEMDEPAATVPIIALTASAQAEVQESVTAVGMNGYLLKPFKPEELYAALLGAFNHGSLAETPAPEGEEPSVGRYVYINLSYLEEVFGNNNEDKRAMIEDFMKQTPPTLQSLHEAIEKTDYEALTRLSHKLKPTVSYMGINSIVGDAVLLHSYCDQKEDIEKIRKLVDRIEKITELAREELRQELIKLS